MAFFFAMLLAAIEFLADVVPERNPFLELFHLTQQAPYVRESTRASTSMHGFIVTLSSTSSTSY